MGIGIPFGFLPGKGALCRICGVLLVARPGKRGRKRRGKLDGRLTRSAGKRGGVPRRGLGGDEVQSAKQREGGGRSMYAKDHQEKIETRPPIGLRRRKVLY